jgi:hypothetical protein
MYGEVTEFELLVSRSSDVKYRCIQRVGNWDVPDSSDPLYMSVKYSGPTAQPCTGNRELACVGPFMSM